MRRLLVSLFFFLLLVVLDGVPTGEGAVYGAGIESSTDGGVHRLEHAGGWGGFTIWTEALG